MLDFLFILLYPNLPGMNKCFSGTSLKFFISFIQLGWIFKQSKDINAFSLNDATKNGKHCLLVCWGVSSNWGESSLFHPTGSLNEPMVIFVSYTPFWLLFVTTTAIGSSLKRLGFLSYSPIHFGGILQSGPQFIIIGELSGFVLFDEMVR